MERVFNNMPVGDRFRRDRGATAVLVAISMLLLLGISAIAVDLGSGWNERRQDQTASDLGAVAGALSFGSKPAIVAQVLATSRDNLDTTYTDAEWEALWEGCTDPDRPVDFSPLPEPAAWGSGTLDCISLSPSFLRVRTPVQKTLSFFAQTMGIPFLSTDADTVVTVLPTGNSVLLPFAVRADTPAGHICLDTGPGGTSLPPCDGPEKGSFGNIAPVQFGNPFTGTQPECDKQASANNMVPDAIAMGIDHILWKYPPASWTDTGWLKSNNTGKNEVKNSSVNMDLCSVVGGTAVPSDGVPIDGGVIDTGNSTKADVTEGLISTTAFVDGGKGRLLRSTNTVAVKDGNSTLQLDNTPLWSHLLADSGTVAYDDVYAPASCNPTTVDAGTPEQKSDKMHSCLRDYENGGYSGQIFGVSILDTPRFGVAPQLWHDNLGSGLSYRPIENFRVVYLNGVWFDLKSASIEPFYPDQTGQWCPVKKKGVCAQIVEVEQLTAFLLTNSMLPEAARIAYPGLDEAGIEVSIFQ